MLRSLQATRATAAVMVVLFHLGLAITKYFDTDLFAAPWGRTGVEFFFVLSGFIITLAHRQEIGQPRQFIKYMSRRLVRIYPIYWVVFAIAFAGAARLLNHTPQELLSGLLLLPTGTAPVISVAWSLQYEMAFYVIFGACILHPVIGIAVAAAVWLWVPVLAHTYLLMFLAGVAAALLHQAAVAVPGRLTAAAGAAIFGVAAWVETQTGQSSPAWYALGAFLVIVGLAAAERRGWAFGGSRPMQLLGDASYAIYLVHYPLVSATCKAVKLTGLTGMPGAALTWTLGLAGALAAGIVLHLWVERPMARRIGKLHFLFRRVRA